MILEIFKALKMRNIFVCSPYSPSQHPEKTQTMKHRNAPQVEMSAVFARHEQKPTLQAEGVEGEQVLLFFSFPVCRRGGGHQPPKATTHGELS